MLMANCELNKMKPEEILSEYIPIDVPTQEQIDAFQGEDYEKNYMIRRRVGGLSTDRYRYYTHSAPAKTLRGYLDTDCVILYIKDLFGGMFIMKSKMKHFAFFFKKQDLMLGGMGYSIMDIPIKEALDLIEKIPDKYKNDEDHFKIVDEKELQRCKNMLLVEELKD